MPRPRNSVPTYRLHKRSGQAIVAVYDAAGARRELYLGRYGSQESRAEYSRIVAELNATGGHYSHTPGHHLDLTVAEVALLFLKHADGHYRHPDGTPTGEASNFRMAIRPLRELYGHTPASAFGPRSLQAVRQAMVDSGLSRRLINYRVARLRRVFAWAVAEELIAPSVLHGLQAVAGLKRGRCAARESEPVGPVADSDVAAVLPHVTPPVAAMIRVQRLTGMRPGEVTSLRPCDLDRSGPVWYYRPARHKGSWLDKARVVAVGPQAQEVLRPFLDGAADPDAHTFSPAASARLRREAMRAARKTPVQPSQVCRAKASPKRTPGASYNTRAYAHAIRRGCQKAGVPVWGPNRLRHSFATEVRRRFDLEAAQVMLGHARADVTQVYAEKDLTLAEKVAAQIG